MTVQGTRSVTVIRRNRRTGPDGVGWARDSHGNAVYDDEQIVVARCSVQPATGTETDDQGRVLASSLTVVYAPLSWPDGILNAVLIDGVRFEVEGRPARWTVPRPGHVVVTLREGTS